MMVAGQVMIIGGVASGIGFARTVYDVLEAGTDFQGITGPGLQQAKSQLAAIANACAELITYVQANAVVNTSITASGVPIAWTGTGTGTVA
jgi:hypothetical protein